MRLFVLVLTVGLGLGSARADVVIKPYEFQPGGEQPAVAAEWGELQVPAKHAEPDGATITLSFVRFPSTSENPGHPIVYLAGGPGGSGIGTARGGRFPLFMALREVADVIAFDQRGTGDSSPGPRCQYTHAFPLSKPGVRSEVAAYAREAAAYCLDWWRGQGVDISIFNTHESALDLEALRVALGAEKLNLWGISYGTHLALEAYRVLGSERIERGVLASPEGLTQTVKLPAYSDNYFERVAALAAAQYPEFLSLLRAQMQRLEDAPVTLEFTPEGAQAPVSLTLGPIAYRMLIAFAMVKNPQNVAALPRMVYGIEQQGFGIIVPYLMGFLADPMTFSSMSFGMDVASGITPARLQLVEQQARDAIIGDAMNYPLPHVLGVPGLPDLGDDFRREVISDIETLVLTGTLDGRTFPEEHAEILAGLSEGRQIIVENAGHDLFMVSPEVQDAVVRFFRDGSVAALRIVIDPPVFQ